MQLPGSWVDALFARLAVRYGTAWAAKWEGLDMAAVRADWAEELGGFGANPEALKRALANLPPDRPPTVAQFRALCIGSPGDVHDKPKRLEAPSASPEVVAAVKAVATGPKSDVDPKAWAWALRRREHLLDRTLSAAQRAMWRAALKSELAAERSVQEAQA